MPRCPRAERALVSAFHDQLAARPGAAAVAGVIEVHDDGRGYRIAVGFLDEDPVTLVALAHECLRKASDRLVAGGWHGEFADLWARIERAQGELRFAQDAPPS